MSATARSIAKGLKSLAADFKAMDKAKGTMSAKIKMSVNSNVNKFIKYANKFPDASRLALKDALKIVANDLHATLDEAMESKVWAWTQGTRDIIDTGALRDSGKVVVENFDIVISYGEEYAAIVHFSGYVKSGGETGTDIYYPARPWVTATLEGGGPVPKFDFIAELEPHFLRLLAQRVAL